MVKTPLSSHSQGGSKLYHTSGLVQLYCETDLKSVNVFKNVKNLKNNKFDMKHRDI